MRTYTLSYNPYAPKRQRIHCYEDQEGKYTKRFLSAVAKLWEKNDFQEVKDVTRKDHEDILSELILTLLCEYGSNIPYNFLQPRKVFIENEVDKLNSFGMVITFAKDLSGNDVIETSVFHGVKDNPSFTDEEYFYSEAVSALEEKWANQILENARKTDQ